MSISITLMITLSLTVIVKLIDDANYKIEYNEDIYLAAKQVSQYLMGSYFIDLDDDYHYISINNKEMSLGYDNHRLVKKDGYEVLVSNIDDVSFCIKDNLLYMTIVRDNQAYEFLISYVREKKNNESE